VTVRLDPGTAEVAYDDVPLGRFHLRVAAASTGGVFSDGFGLGIIGTALAASGGALTLTHAWTGLLGGASLAGLFVGALLTGPVADRFGRRRIFAYNMAALAALSMLQYVVGSRAELLVLRLGIGFVLGTDYVVSKAMLTEFTPRRRRGAILSLLSVAWAGGFACAFAIGVLLVDRGADAWRWMLVAGSVPCLLILPLRVTMPESPLWLVDHGQVARAREIVREKLGKGVGDPLRGPSPVVSASRWRQLFSRAWRRRTLVACAFFTFQVIPYFAVGTFVAQVLDALNVQGARSGGLIYNGALLIGAAAGLLVVDRLPRRVFLVGSFALAAAAMLLLTLVPGLPAVGTFTLFAIFALVLSAASNLVYVYLPELFPTDLRASGIGLAVAASRIGSAVGTFLLPILVDSAGIHAALGVCVATLLLGGAICYAWAPETRHSGLALVSAAPHPSPDCTERRAN